jgi:hypothetical protein
MNELVRQKRQATPAARSILAGAENDLIAHGVRSGTDRARRIRRARAGVDAYCAEIVAKARFEERAGGRIQRFAGPQIIKEVVGDRCIDVVPGRFDAALHQLLLFGVAV